MTNVDYAEAIALRPIIDAIAAYRNVSITLPATSGKRVVVSVRASTSKHVLDARQLRLVEGAITENIGEPISISTLSGVAGLSRSHFFRAFRASVGRTPHAHIISMRIERAMQLMRESGSSLSQVAAATGFSDQAHFSNTFRRAVKMTPAQWRKSAH